MQSGLYYRCGPVLVIAVCRCDDSAYGIYNTVHIYIYMVHLLVWISDCLISVK